MRRFLLATVAVAALALAVPMAIAQNTTAQPTYTHTMPMPVDTQSPVDADAMELDAQTQVNPDMATPNAMTAQSAQDAAPSNDNYVETDPATSAQADGSDTDQMADESYASTDAQYAAQNDQSANTMMDPARLQEAALDAGMAGTPMNAADVCAMREVDLGSSRLTQDTRQQLRFAADRASACEIDQVVISAPSGREQAVRQILINAGVDAADIEVQEASELAVEMRFAGVATSSEYFATLFNANRQLASNNTATMASPDALADDSMMPDDTMMQSEPTAMEYTDEPEPVQDTKL